MEYKNQTESRAFQEIGYKIVLERRLLQKVGLFFIAAEMCLKY